MDANVEDRQTHSYSHSYNYYNHSHSNSYNYIYAYTYAYIHVPCLYIYITGQQEPNPGYSTVVHPKLLSANAEHGAPIILRQEFPSVLRPKQLPKPRKVLLFMASRYSGDWSKRNMGGDPSASINHPASIFKTFRLLLHIYIYIERERELHMDPSR